MKDLSQDSRCPSKCSNSVPPLCRSLPPLRRKPAVDAISCFGFPSSARQLDLNARFHYSNCDRALRRMCWKCSKC